MLGKSRLLLLTTSAANKLWSRGAHQASLKGPTVLESRAAVIVKGQEGASFLQVRKVMLRSDKVFQD